MSTLAERHDGLDRVLRGLSFIVSELISAMPRRDRGLSGRTIRNLEIAADLPTSATVIAASQQSAVGQPSAYARWRQKRSARRADREFEALLQGDPRMRREFEAMRGRAEWSD